MISRRAILRTLVALPFVRLFVVPKPDPLERLAEAIMPSLLPPKFEPFKLVDDRILDES